MYQLKLKFLSLVLFLGLCELHGVTFYVSNNGSNNNTGSRAHPLKTISRGAELAHAGDTVFVLEGIYRERVSPPRGGAAETPIVYMAEPGKRVYIKGSDVYEGTWKKSSNSVFVADLDRMQFTDDCYIDDANPFKVLLSLIDSTTLTCGQVFVEGIPYLQKTTKAAMNEAAGSWWYDTATNKISVHFQPQHSPENTVEITTRRRIFAPHGTTMGLGYINVEGFIMEHCGNQFPRWVEGGKKDMQSGALGLQSGHHWVVRNNVIRYAANAGLDCGFLYQSNERQGTNGWGWHNQVTDNLIENNYLLDNGCVGICGAGTERLIVRNNVVMWNHNQHYNMRNEEQAGIKLHGLQRGLISGNYVAENFAHGIWLDNEYPNTRITNNAFVHNATHGIWIELGVYRFGEGVLVDHNVIMNNGTAATVEDRQIYMHDASGCLFVNNLIAGSRNEAVQLRQVSTRTPAGGTPARSDQHAFYNNIFCNNGATYNILYPTAMGGEQRFLGNLYDKAGNRPMQISNECAAPSPLSDEALKTRVAEDINVSKSKLSAAGAFTTTNRVKLTVNEWQTFWHKFTDHNDSDAEIMNDLSAEYLPETQSVKLYLPAMLTKRLNSRWDTPYKGIWKLTEVNSYPGPFDNLHVGDNVFQVYKGTLPILERGKLPDPIGYTQTRAF